MNKTTLDSMSPLLFIGIMLLLAVGAGWYASALLTPSTPDMSAEDAESIAKYKEWIRTNDLPFVGGKIKPEELPTAYSKVIEFDIRNGDLKSARSYIRQTIQKKLDGQVLELAEMPEAKELIGKVQDGQEKVTVLKEIAVQKGKVDMADEFCSIPFDPAACPEEAQEIARIYEMVLLPSKGKDYAIKKVIEEVEKKCLVVKE